jgi:hypothetical protein
VPDRECAVQVLLDKQEISEIVLRYARGIDRLDWELVASCFHEDGVVDSSFFKHGAQELYAARLAGDDREHLGSWADLSAHYVLNCLVSVDGDTAGGETYCVALHRTRKRDEEIPVPIDDPGRPGGSDGEERDVVIGLRYIDRFDRRDGTWKITRREFVWEWTRVDAVLGRWTIDPAGYRRGQRDRGDLSYSALA